MKVKVSEKANGREARSSDQVIRLVIADDHPIVLRGLVDLMQTTDHIQVVGEAGDGQEAIRLVRELSPDVLLLDLVMPNKGGLEVIEELKISCPSVRILVLTSFSESDQVLSTIKGGATGYMLKESSPSDLLQAIQDIHRGLSPLHPHIAQQVISEFQQAVDLNTLPSDTLTAREREVLDLVGQGQSNKEVAQNLWISPKTVSKHVSNILAKLNLSNRTQLALYAQRSSSKRD